MSMTLSSRLGSATVQADGQDNWFIPNDQLNRILDRDSVKEELAILFGEESSELEKLVDRICGQDRDQRPGVCRKVFAVLVFIGHGRCIKQFIAHDISDADLPLRQDRLILAPKRAYRGPYLRLDPSQARSVLTDDDCATASIIPKASVVSSVTSPDDKGSALQKRQDYVRIELDDWSDNSYSNFLTYQWRVNAPFFTNNTSLQGLMPMLEDQTILPWAPDHRLEDLNITNGHGNTRAIRIHHAHHDYSQSVFALKTFHGKGSYDAVAAKIEVLRRSSFKDETHLTRLFAAFYWNDECHLLFPWAYGGSLEDLWQSNRNRPLNREIITWISDQCHGVAKGLCQIHERQLSDWSGAEFEGDIKPNNILWFKHPQDSIGAGILKICDFDLRQFHSTEITKISRNSEWYGFSPTYRPPEWDLAMNLDGRKKPYSQRANIWQLGCVYLEFVTWILLGTDGIDKFSIARVDDDQPKTRRSQTRRSQTFREDVFFQVEAGMLRATIKDSVTNWIKNLHENSSCSSYLHEFLDLIEKHMLVADQNERAKCDFVRDELSKISILYRNSDDYTNPNNDQVSHLGTVENSHVESSSYQSIFDNDDTDTIYTSPSSVAEVTIQHYISTLANDLFTRTKSDALGEEVIEKVANALPRLLKAFSLALGHGQPSQIHRDVMVFIHRHRSAIANDFRNKIQQPTERAQEPRSTWAIERFIADNELFEGHTGGHPDWQEPDSDSSRSSIEAQLTFGHEVLDIPGMEEYISLISNNPGYEWLLGRLRREISMSRAELDALADIHDAILNTLPRKNEVSKNKSSESTCITYNVDWDILLFLQGECYEEPGHEAIAYAITITGSWSNAQALTTQQYLEQTWPLTGLQTLNFIQNLLRSAKYEAKMTYFTPSHVDLEGSLKNGLLVVTASGIPEFIAEIGEQLAWLGAALRPTNPDLGNSLGIAYMCSPTITRTETQSERAKSSYSISFTTNCDDGHDTNSPGQCWRSLFRGPVIAGGFPVPSRVKENTGLEAPLGMLVTLAGALFIDTFKSKVFIKGYNAMLVPTKRSGECLVWHLLYNENPGHRISYLDADNIEFSDTVLSDVSQYRHVIGWCSYSVSIVGTIDATHPIALSQLPVVHAQNSLEKVEVTAGMFVNLTAAFRLAERQKPLRITRPGYFDKLLWLSKKYFIFWDEGDRKGWLVSAISTLLHILRGYLQNGRRKFGSRWLLDTDKLHDIPHLSDADSALQVLTDEKNRVLPLYIDDLDQNDNETTIQYRETQRTIQNSRPKYYTLQNKIDHIYSILEKCVDLQVDMERRNGISIDLHGRRQLEGWDFKDLVIGEDPCYLQVARFETIGKGWVDLARAVHAVTLFGRGFGELIKPKYSPHSPCRLWSSVPSGRDYLVARVSDLYNIIDNNGGDIKSNPRILAGDILWHVGQHTFQKCPCGGVNNAKHHEPVQDLFLRKVLKNWNEQPLVGLEEDGAVIFTHDKNLYWRRRHNEEAEADENSTPVLEASLESQGVELSSGIPLSNHVSTSGPSNSMSVSEQSRKPITGVQSLNQALRAKMTDTKRKLWNKFTSKGKPLPVDGNDERQTE